MVSEEARKLLLDQFWKELLDDAAESLRAKADSNTTEDAS